jgi:sirohydrochlorin cobaltochelatase
LEAAGFKVKTYIHGLGENAAVRKMFVERANEAYTELTTETGHQTGHHMKK